MIAAEPSGQHGGMRPAPPEAEEFMIRGACVGVDPAVMFPDAEDKAERKRQVAAAKSICARCEVRPECLYYALRYVIRSGVWGGVDESGRDRIARDIRPALIDHGTQRAYVIDSTTAPPRRITGTIERDGRLYHRLDCGHELRPGTNSERKATMRRCWLCDDTDEVRTA